MNIKLTLVIIFFWPGQAFPSWGPHWSQTQQQPFAPQSLHTHGSSPGGQWWTVDTFSSFKKHFFSSFGVFTHQPHLSALIPGIPPACANCTTDQCVIWHLPTHLFSGVSIFWRRNHLRRKFLLCQPFGIVQLWPPPQWKVSPSVHSPDWPARSPNRMFNLFFAQPPHPSREVDEGIGEVATVQGLVRTVQLGVRLL